MILSIIIPVYNTEEYLDECLGSVCAIPMEDMEILCVNDGSTDDSAQAVRRWQQRDPRIRLIEQENMGLSGARNTGIREACGEYIYFLDSDDWLTDTVTIPECIERMRAEELDVLLAEATVIYDPPVPEGVWHPNHQRYFTLKNVYPEIYEGPNLLRMLRLNSDWCASVPTKIFRREHLTENGISFIVGQLHEDEYFSLCSIFLSHRVGASQVPLFFRRVHPNSITAQPANPARVTGNMINMVELLRFLEAHRDICELDADVGYAIREAKRNAAELFDCMSEEDRASYLEGLRPDLLFYHRLFVEDQIRLYRKDKTIDELKQKLKNEKARTVALRNSPTFRIGRFLTAPIRLLRRLLTRS